MSFQINLVSAFGRGETLAMALHENGFKVRIYDFTAAFPPEYQRGAGPFPMIDKAHHAVQREYLNEVELQPQGLTFWLKDGPIELTGPYAGVHIHSSPEVQLWKTNSPAKEFSKNWLQRFLRQFASPYFAESWDDVSDAAFPAELPLGSMPLEREAKVHNFERVRGKGAEVYACTRISDLRSAAGRIEEIEIMAGQALAANADQWVWCLSSTETKGFNEEVTRKIFGRSNFAPEWAWLSFAGQMAKGPWNTGLPASLVLLGDVFLPWCYANMSILRRTDKTKFRVWLKVPLGRVHEIDARRRWANDLQKLLSQRLPMADWKIDSGDWNICPHSEIYSPSMRGQRLQQWRNCTFITPETLPRLDVSARLEREAETFKRLVQWRNDQMKKQGARRDSALHAT